MELRRFIQAGAVFADKLDSVTDLERRGFIKLDDLTVSEDGIDFSSGGLHLTGFRDLDICTEFSLTFDLTLNEYASYDQRILDKSGQLLIMIEDSASEDVGTLRIQIVGVSPDEFVFSKIPLNETHKYGITISDTTINFYIDGVLSDTDSFTGTKTTTTDDVYIGNNSGKSRDLKGSLKNFLLFDRELTAQEESDLHNGTTFNYDKYLIHNWDMSQVNTIDTVGDLNLTGVNTNNTNIVNGIHNNSLATNLNGSNQYTQKANVDLTTEITNELSIFACINTQQKTSINAIFVHKEGLSQNKGFAFYKNSYNTDNNKIVVEKRNGTTGLATYSDNLIVDGEWHIPSCSMKDTDTEIYIDGVKSTVTSAGTNVNISACISDDTYLGIGESTKFTLPLKGKIDNIYLFNKWLTPLQHTDMYNRITKGRV